MASLELAFDILARDRASKEFNNVGDAADRAGDKGKKFGLLLAGAVTAGVAGLALVLKGGAAEFADNQKAAAQFEATLKSTGDAAGITTAGIKSLADSIESKTGTDGAQVVAGAAVLATFTKIRNEVGAGNDVFSRATQAGVDLASKGFGTIESNAISLGKALNDPVKGITALGRQGVTFTEQQKDTIKALVATGDTLGAQKLILAELEMQVGGSAEAYGKTLPGQLDRARQAFDGVKETVFVAVLPAVTALLLFVTERLIPGFQDLAEKVGPTVEKVGEVFREQIAPAVVTSAKAFATFFNAIPLPVLVGIGSAIAVLATALALSAAATAVQTAAAAALNAVLLLNPFVLVTALLIALVAGLAFAYRNSETFRNVVTTAFNAVRAVASAVFTFVAGFIGQQLAAVVSIARGAVSIVVGLFTGDFGRVKEGVAQALGGVLSLVTALPGRILSALGNLGGLLVNAGRELMSGLARGIGEKIAAVVGKVRDAVAQIGRLLPGSPIKDGPLKSWNNGGAGLRLMDMLGDGITAGLPGVRGALSSGLGGINGAVSASVGVGTSDLTGMGGGMAEEIRGLRSDIQRLPRDYQLGQRQMAGV